MTKKSKKSKADKETVGEVRRIGAMREIIESVVIAFVLAFLFRTFEAEAFVIPTGSMASTLMGVHKDVECPRCGFAYQVGASHEEEAAEIVAAYGQPRDSNKFWNDVLVARGTCPNCRYVMDMNEPERQETYNGDRILVSKFAYQFADPERWDVIVFRYPDQSWTNYIKRLIALPGETVDIKYGDIFITPPGETESTIARKPTDKLMSMARLVHDTDFVPMLSDDRSVYDAGWPRRWSAAPDWLATNQQMSQAIRREVQPLDGQIRMKRAQINRATRDERPALQAELDDLENRRHAALSRPILDWAQGLAGPSFAPADDEKSFALSDAGEQMSWLRYRHLTPDEAVSGAGGETGWDALLKLAATELLGPDVTPAAKTVDNFLAYNESYPRVLNIHEIYFKKENPHKDQPREKLWVGDLIFEATLDVAGDSGTIVLEAVEDGVFFRCTINVETGEAKLSIHSPDGAPSLDFDEAAADGTVPMANTIIKGAGKYRVRFANVDDQVRLWAAEADSWGDVEEVHFDRPATYTSPGHNLTNEGEPQSLADKSPLGVGAEGTPVTVSQLRVLRDIYYTDPGAAGGSPEHVHQVQVPAGKLFAMGDNSDRSKDSRYFGFVDVEKELIGKALFVYWPHAWNIVAPNFDRMKFVK